jgi:hypothetical protein
MTSIGPKRTNLYFNEAGPVVQYDGELLHVEDLNPHIQTKWRMSRWELIKLAVACLAATLRRYRHG